MSSGTDALAPINLKKAYHLPYAAERWSLTAPPGLLISENKPQIITQAWYIFDAAQSSVTYMWELTQPCPGARRTGLLFYRRWDTWILLTAYFGHRLCDSSILSEGTQSSCAPTPAVWELEQGRLAHVCLPGTRETSHASCDPSRICG